MWKTRFELADRHRPSPTSSQSNLEILTEEEEEEVSAGEPTPSVSLTIHRPNSSHSLSKHQLSLPTIIESQDPETTSEPNVDDIAATTRTNSAEKLRQFTIERRIYELLQQQRDVRQEKVRQYFFNFASTHCQNRKRIVS